MIWAERSELVLVLVESRGHGLEALALADAQKDSVGLGALSQRILHDMPRSCHRSNNMSVPPSQFILTAARVKVTRLFCCRAARSALQVPS